MSIVLSWVGIGLLWSNVRIDTLSDNSRSIVILSKIEARFNVISTNWRIFIGSLFVLFTHCEFLGIRAEWCQMFIVLARIWIGLLWSFERRNLLSDYGRSIVVMNERITSIKIISTNWRILIRFPFIFTP